MQPSDPESSGNRPTAQGKPPAEPRKRSRELARSLRERVPARLVPVLPARLLPTLGLLVLLGRGLVRWALRLALPLASAATVLQAFPYHATVQGVPFQVQGTLFSRPGLSADTTVGSWIFPDLTGLPVGVHVSPENVDILSLTKAASGDRAAFVDRLEADFVHQIPRIATWLLAETLIGVALGLAAAAAINMAVRYLRGTSRRPHEIRHRARQLGAAVAVVLAVGAYGWFTYNPDWVRQSQLTGTLAAAQLFPAQLSQYYQQQSKAFDVLGSVLGVQAALQSQIDAEQTPATALRIMFISDMHLAANYPLVQMYANSYDVDLIINTGDESEFGTGVELTPGFLDALRAVAARTPMLWLAGNHDSPAVEHTMSTVPGVTVLGSKTATAGGYEVTAGVVRAFGLTIAGLPDPRVYGGPGAYGADDPKVTDPLERSAVDDAVAAVSDGAAQGTAAKGSAARGTSARGTSARDAGGTEAEGATSSSAGARGPSYDIFATHEPVAAAELRARLPGRIRQTDAGHTHHQNDVGDIQRHSAIDLVEGSTGAGGLDNLYRGPNRPPIEFSIESVAPNCQFTRVVRFQIRSPQLPQTPPAEADAPQAYGDNVTASTIYFKPQDVAPGRTCGVDQGIGKPGPLRAG